MRENNDKFFSALKKEIFKNSVDVSYDTLTVRNVQVVKPHVLKSQVGYNQIERDLSALLADDYCAGLSKTLVKYSINHLTDNFISIVKTVDERFCPHYASDSYYSETLNYIRVDGITYQIKGSAAIKETIYKLAKKRLSQECIDAAEFSGIANDLFFQKGKMYALNPIASKECQIILQVQLVKQALDFTKVPQVPEK